MEPNQGRYIHHRQANVDTENRFSREADNQVPKATLEGISTGKTGNTDNEVKPPIRVYHLIGSKAGAYWPIYLQFNS